MSVQYDPKRASQTLFWRHPWTFGDMWFAYVYYYCVLYKYVIDIRNNDRKTPGGLMLTVVFSEPLQSKRPWSSNNSVSHTVGLNDHSLTGTLYIHNLVTPCGDKTARNEGFQDRQIEGFGRSPWETLLNLYSEKPPWERFMFPVAYLNASRPSGCRMTGLRIHPVSIMWKRCRGLDFTHPINLINRYVKTTD